jgi:hypothetical protein
MDLAEKLTVLAVQQLLDTSHEKRGEGGEWEGKAVSKCLLFTFEQSDISSSLTLLRNNAYTVYTHTYKQNSV